MEIQIDNCHILRSDRTNNNGVVASYIRSVINYVQKDFFPNSIEKIFFEILLPETTPISVEVMYRLPSQSKFLWNYKNDFKQNWHRQKRDVHSRQSQPKHEL